MELLLFVAAAVAMFMMVGSKAAAIPQPERKESASNIMGIDYLIRKAASEHGVPVALIKATIREESNFKASARNVERKKNDPSDDAIGLMQVRQTALTDYNNAHGIEYTLNDLFQPSVNIEVGTWYLSRLVKKYGSMVGAEMYNTGEQGYLSGVRNTARQQRIAAYYKTYSAA